MATRDRDRDRELLIPVGEALGLDGAVARSSSSPSIVSPPTSFHHLHHNPGKEAFFKVLRSWASKKFMTGCVILFPMAMTFYITWFFVHFVDGFFSPIYNHLGINVFDQSSGAFKEVVIVRHPRVEEYTIGFITSTVVLRSNDGDEELSTVYIPTNHLYLGDIFLINSKEVIRPSLSVREGIEIVLSGGMSIPPILSAIELKPILTDHLRVVKSPKFSGAQD